MPVDGALAVASVACDLVDVADLSTTVGAATASASVAAWLDRLDRPDSPDATADPGPALPIAAHAEPDPTRTAVGGAAYADLAFADTRRTGVLLDGVLDATLRPYQRAGIAWLMRSLDRHGGALLADEMGLGKTLQAIGVLALRDAGPHAGHLVVCPTGLISNWRREIDRFAPALADQVTVVSYARLRQRAAEFAGTRWRTVVFDEAQALKNPRTKVSRAAHALHADGTVALTGTPVENSLDDLWSILKAVAPSMFPIRAVFRRRFTKAVESGDDAALGRLRAAASPVMLARTKDRAAGALPPKIDNPVLCDLTDEQAALYDAELARTVADGFGSGLERHGRLLAVLTRLKQICNHPALLGADADAEPGPSALEPGRSGKLDVIAALLAENVAAGRPTLVFTQYRAAGELLAAAASAAAEASVPFFHGGLSPAIRTELADRFQSGDGPPVLVMSLKAGGSGLTLTRACDVVHFDRWWNPAVEAQATDRAHRIGQDRPVTVTTLTTATTLEEHIDEMHRRKALLGVHSTDDSIVSSLAALDDERLLDVLARRRETR